MLILASETDAAARNIRDHLLTVWDHNEAGEYPRNGDRNGRPVFRSPSGKVLLATILGPALELDNPHLSLYPEGPVLDVILYLSRHQSVSGNKTLTVHPIGNFSDARFGGRERTIVPTAPHLMTHALRLLSAMVPEGYECTFEATHHGPYNDVPTFFIEIGSTLEEWSDPEAVNAISRTVRQLIHDYEHDHIHKGKVCVGLGGGHYSPRHTRFALKEGLDFGHILPSYARKSLDTALAEQIIGKTPGAERVCAHGKKHRKEGRIFSELGLEYVEY